MKLDSGGTYYDVLALTGPEATWIAQDVTINGVNLGLTYLKQFAALMQEKSKDFDVGLQTWQRELQSSIVKAIEEM